jgi:hypothetical protein
MLFHLQKKETNQIILETSSKDENFRNVRQEKSMIYFSLRKFYFPLHDIKI